jgi:hypothetical protein
LYNKDNIKNVITSKFEEKMCCDNELEGKMKLRYYNDVMNPNPEDKNYLFGQLPKCSGMKKPFTFMMKMKINFS